MQQSLKRLEMGVFALAAISVINIILLVMSSNPAPKEEQSGPPWQEDVQLKLSEINENLNVLEEEINDIEKNTLSQETIAASMVEAIETSIALIIETVENKKSKFQPLREKIKDIDKDVSLLKEEFSKIEKKLKKE